MLLIMWMILLKKVNGILYLNIVGKEILKITLKSKENFHKDFVKISLPV